MGSFILNVALGSIYLLLTSSSNGEAQEIMAGEIVLKYKENTTQEEMLKIENKYRIKKIREISSIKVFLYISPEENVMKLIESLKSEKAVLYVEPNFSQKTYASLNDPLLSQQWYLQKIKFPEARDKKQLSWTTYVAVVDTGVNKFHSDLGRCLSYEKDFVDGDDDANDESDGVGHGTAVAGIIAATQNNALGIAGISEKAKIMSLRTANQIGQSDQFINASAIVQAADWGANIINCSFGGTNAPQALYDAISYANSKGVLIVCAAGNESVSLDVSPRYPAAYDLPNIISVASSDRNDALAYDSNYGELSVDIAAPGVDIYSCGINSTTTTIVNWTFEADSLGRENWNGWEYFDWGSGWGGGWFEWLNGGLWTRKYITQYWPSSKHEIKSPFFSSTSYHSVRCNIQLLGFVGSGDYIRIGAVKNLYHSDTFYTFDAGNVTGTYSLRSPQFDQSSGSLAVQFESDNTGDGYWGLLGASVTGKEASSSANTLYQSVSGTSFAAPVVSGIAAFLMEEMPSKTHLEIKNAILSTARKSSALSGKVLTGGVVDLNAAFSFLLNPGLLITSDVSPASITFISPFSYQITASGYPTSYAAKGLPAGLKVNTATGLISGNPSKTGSYTVTLQALKKGSATATATKVFTVVQVPTFSYAATINAKRNSSVNVKTKVAGYPAPTFSLVSGSLPPGLSLNSSTAAITGKPTTVGTYAITVRGSNSAGNTDRSTTMVVK